MSGECDDCGEHTLDCYCYSDTRLQLALTALRMALNNLSILGYELPQRLEFKKIIKKEA